MIQIRSRHLFLILYLLFIVYGSLFPLVDWRIPPQGFFAIWSETAEKHVSRSDLLTNIFAYIPLGFLLGSICSGRLGIVARILLATTMGMLLSLLMESIQIFLPARTSSPVDLLLNTLSTLIGVFMYSWIRRGGSTGEWLRTWRSENFREGKVVDIGLAVIAAWGATQLAPFVLSIDVGDIKNGLKPLWLTLHDFSRFNAYRAVTYALTITSLGAVLLLVLKNRLRAVCWLGLFCFIVLSCKIAVVGRQLSVEALAGLACGLLLTMVVLFRFPLKLLALVGGCSVACAFIVDELRADLSQTVAFHAFNWIPFSSQMAESVSGIGSILDGLWPFSMLGFFAVSYTGGGRGISKVVIGAVSGAAVFALEYTQTTILGRYPDITTVILAVTGWTIPWLFMGNRESEQD